MKGNQDDTVVVRAAPARRGGRVMVAGVVGLAVIGVAIAGWWRIERPPSSPATVAEPAPPATPPAEAIPLASEAAIRAESPAARTVLRFSDNPAVVVIDFPTLAEQGRMFNRLAAWAEKAGVAHDRIPDDDTLAAAIAASGTTPDTYYYGHDYSGAAVKRFFALAAEEHVALRPEEEVLRRIAARAEAEPAGFGAVITVVRADEANNVSPQARATILHHELSHGEYFTMPAYSDYVASFWQNILTPSERAAFRTYLTREGYDPALEDLMRNETQAYLMNTPDPAFFDPTRLDIPPARLAQIRSAFLAGMPPGWLRDDIVASGIAPREPAPAPALPAPPATPPRKRRRPQRAGRVSRGRAVAATDPPRRRSASMAARKVDT